MRWRARLSEGLAASADVDVLYPVQSNELFVRMPDHRAEALRAAGFQFHGWPGRPGVYRLVTGFCTEAGEVDEFLAAVSAEPVSMPA